MHGSMVRGNDSAITGAFRNGDVLLNHGTTQPRTSRVAMIAKRPRMLRMVVRVIRRPARQGSTPRVLRESGRV